MLLAANLLSNTGNRNPRGEYATLCSVMERIAIPMAHGLPVTPVIRALAHDDGLADSALRRARWRDRLTLVAADIEAGRSFADAISRHLGQALPAYFVPALREAESKGRLQTALPVLARSLSGSPAAIKTLQGVLVYPMIQLVMIMTVLMMLMVFIVPKFAQMIDEMAPGFQASHLQLLVGLSRALYSGSILMPLLLVLFVGGVILSVILRFTPEGRLAIHDLFVHVPLLGRIPRRTGLVEAASAMSAFLATGMDVVGAAQSTRSTLRRAWARRVFNQFIRLLEAGTPWQQAWESTEFSTPLSTWLLRNAAAREQPQDGFQSVADWALDDLNRHLCALGRWAEPLLVMTNGLLVGGIVYALIGSLFDTIYATLAL